MPLKMSIFTGLLMNFLKLQDIMQGYAGQAWGFNKVLVNALGQSKHQENPLMTVFPLHQIFVQYEISDGIL